MLCKLLDGKHHDVSACQAGAAAVAVPATSEGVKLLPQLGAAACSCQQAVFALQHSLCGCCDMRKLARCDQDMRNGCMHVCVTQSQFRYGAMFLYHHAGSSARKDRSAACCQGSCSGCLCVCAGVSAHEAFASDGQRLVLSQLGHHMAGEVYHVKFTDVIERNAPTGWAQHAMLQIPASHSWHCHSSVHSLA